MKVAYIPNYYTLKKLTETEYKLTYLKAPLEKYSYQERENNNKGVNAEKLNNNISRARSMIFDYSMCNDFDYFVTLTLSDNFHDRYDLKSYIKELGDFIRQKRRDYNSDIQYLLIPEKHENGAWHMHGLIKGIPQDKLSINKHGYLDWEDYKNKFGYISMSKVRNKIAVSKYITKYISKSIKNGNSVTELNKKLYYVTRGLSSGEIVSNGSLDINIIRNIKFDFQNEYIGQKIMSVYEMQSIFKELTLI
ncbi:MAG: hypothetical protein RBR71_13850 [Gudongella sp.]|nr:hypothetical protein [Gudongella sp.]